jgi:hypothetical protein
MNIFIINKNIISVIIKQYTRIFLLIKEIKIILG